MPVYRIQQVMHFREVTRHHGPPQYQAPVGERQGGKREAGASTGQQHAKPSATDGRTILDALR